jgi:hypothetical protein
MEEIAEIFDKSIELFELLDAFFIEHDFLA